MKRSPPLFRKPVPARSTPKKVPTHTVRGETWWQGPNAKQIAVSIVGVIFLSLITYFSIKVVSGWLAEPAPVPTRITTEDLPSPVVPDQPAAIQPANISSSPVPLKITATLSVSVPTTDPTKTIPAVVLPDIPSLQQYMLQLVNDDRKANGVTQVGWDSTAMSGGQIHAKEMARFGFLSHWNLEGYGPDYRYTQAGGLDSAHENVYKYQHSVGADPSSAEQWKEIIRQAEKNFMESPGHRTNILAKEHTHVGIGITYNFENGWLAIAQEFVNHYIVLDSLPTTTNLGQSLALTGRLVNKARNPLLNLAFEAVPKQMTISDLNITSTYTSPSQIYDTIELKADNSGHFETRFSLNNKNQPGLYHIRIWVDTDLGQVEAVNVVIRVR